MSDFNRNPGTVWGRPVSRTETTAVIDSGLRAYMLQVYNYMAIGLAITGLAALGVYMLSVAGDASTAATAVRNGATVPVRVGGMYLTPVGYALFVSPLKWAVILAPLGMVFALSFGIQRMRPATAQIMFWVFSALMGVSLSSIFLVYTHTSIARVFFI